MQEKEKDPNLSAPQEANTTKHVNFLEAEENAAAGGNADNDAEESPTKKAWEELREENKNDR